MLGFLGHSFSLWLFSVFLLFDKLCVFGCWISFLQYLFLFHDILPNVRYSGNFCANYIFSHMSTTAVIWLSCWIHLQFPLWLEGSWLELSMPWFRLFSMTVFIRISAHAFSSPPTSFPTFSKLFCLVLTLVFGRIFWMSFLFIFVSASFHSLLINHKYNPSLYNGALLLSCKGWFCSTLLTAFWWVSSCN